MTYIAHENQTLKAHLEGVAKLSRKNAGKIGCGNYGELLGLLHDLGKYSKQFQDYIKSAVGIKDPDIDDDFVDASELKGKIDHSTAGAQFIWNTISNGTPSQKLFAQVLSLCLVSHHSGLIDCLTADDTHGTYDTFTKRITKSDEKTHYKEVSEKAKDDNEIENSINQILSKPDITMQLESILKNIFDSVPERKSTINCISVSGRSFSPIPF